MDSNKDDASRCLRIAEDAIISGDKERALKFIKMTKRLNPSLFVDELVAACDNLDSVSKNQSLNEKLKTVDGETKKGNEKMKYTEENVELVRNIRMNDDYYAILGLEKNCSVEEIRKAYRKLSLKVHPDKNKAPGSEEAFKKVSKAFTCLSDGNSRSKYDQVGFVDEFDHVQRRNRRPRRRYNTQNGFFDDEFDPDEIFRAFFGQQRDMFHASRTYRTRQARNQPREEEPNVAGPSCLTILQILPFFLLLLLAYLPFSEPDYSLQKNQAYQIPKTTQNMEISFYVRSASASLSFGLNVFDGASISSRRSSIRSFLQGISKVRDMTICRDTFKLICQYSKIEPLPQFGSMSRLRITFRVSDLRWLPTFLKSFPNLKSLILVWNTNSKKMNSEELRRINYS